MPAFLLNNPVNLQVDDELILKEIHLSDADAIFEIINLQREYMKEWLPFVECTHQITDTMAYIRSLTKVPIDHRDPVFTIQYKRTIVGLIGLKDSDWTNHKTEIGYWLSEKEQGKGIMTKCCKQLIHFAFEALELNRIQIKVAAANHKSQQIPIRLGFTYEGIERAGELLLNGYTDVVVYSLLRNEFH